MATVSVAASGGPDDRSGVMDKGLKKNAITFVSNIVIGVASTAPAYSLAATLGFIAGLTAGSEVVFDYSDPPQSMSAERAAAHQRRAARVAALGEPWLTTFTPGALHGRLGVLLLRLA